MRLRVCLVIGLIATIGLAGCFEEGDLVPVQGADTGGDGGNSTVEPGNETGGVEGDGNGTANDDVTNTPPVANLTADVLNGTAPLSVNFTINGTDTDGDNLTWTLLVNGTVLANGTQLPATVSYNFTEAGNWTVLVQVSDGIETVETSLVVAVAAAASGAAPFAGITFEGDVLLPIGANLGAGDVNDYCKGLRLEEQGLDCVWFEITPEMWGLPFTSSSTGEETDLRFTEGCSNDDANVQSFLTVGNEAGQVPEGAGCLIVGEWVIPMSTVTVTIEPA